MQATRPTTIVPYPVMLISHTLLYNMISTARSLTLTTKITTNEVKAM